MSNKYPIVCYFLLKQRKLYSIRTIIYIYMYICVLSKIQPFKSYTYLLKIKLQFICKLEIISLVAH